MTQVTGIVSNRGPPCKCFDTLCEGGALVRPTSIDHLSFGRLRQAVRPYPSLCAQVRRRARRPVATTWSQLDRAIRAPRGWDKTCPCRRFRLVGPVTFPVRREQPSEPGQTLGQHLAVDTESRRSWLPCFGLLRSPEPERQHRRPSIRKGRLSTKRVCCSWPTASRHHESFATGWRRA
jgi:hypothetical protein